MLLFSALNSNKSTGPVAAIGIASALVVMLTFLPALLLVPSAIVAAADGRCRLRRRRGSSRTYCVGGLLALLAVVVFVAAGACPGRAGQRPGWWAFWARWPASRWAFWPKVPRMGDEDEKLSGIWSKVAGTVGRRPRMVWVGTAVGLLALVLAHVARR